MKVYFHPNIILPAGTVEVKFYDYAENGVIGIPECIKEIGDVEEGFEINFGDYYAPECSFVLHNDSSNTIYNLLINSDLFVSVIVNGELYFYGFIDKQTIEPSENFKNEISFSAVGALAYLRNAPIDDFKTEGANGKTQLSFFFNTMASELSLGSEIEYLARRFFKGSNSWYEAYFHQLFTDNAPWGDEDYPNSYDAQCSNGLELLNVLANDFFFYPSLIYDGAQIKLKIIEKDYYNTDNYITIPAVKTEKETFSFVGKSITVDLKNRPETMSDENVRFYAEQSSVYGADDIGLEQIHTFFQGDADGFYTHNILYIQDVNNSASFEEINDITNYNPANPDGISYGRSNHAAIFHAVKSMYFDNKKALDLTLHGLKGTIDGVSKIEYLSPGYRFMRDNTNHYIRYVKRSLVKNETEIQALVLG